jgi:hypothetical protein
MNSIVDQHKASPLLARASGKHIRLQRFAYADLPQLGADPNGTCLKRQKDQNLVIASGSAAIFCTFAPP